MSHLAVDLDRLAAFLDDLARTQAELTARRDEVERRAAELGASWTGASAIAQQAAHTRWTSAAHHVQTALAALHADLRTAHHNYTAAVRVNGVMWSAVP